MHILGRGRPLDAWASSLYVIHMVAGYGALAVLCAAVVASEDLPPWLGWLGLGGSRHSGRFVVTRFSGPFNPPLWAHAYTAVVRLLS
ncbi:MAG: hypothetical protein ACRDWI_16070 [Jiangellaceae bacterium]